MYFPRAFFFSFLTFYLSYCSNVTQWGGHGKAVMRVQQEAGFLVRVSNICICYLCRLCPASVAVNVSSAQRTLT